MAEESGSSVASPEATRQIWAATVDRVKQTVISPSLWRALEAAVPVIWEGEQFVVGVGVSDGQAMGQINTNESRGAIERTLREVARDASIRFRLLEGTTVADWEYTKARDGAAIANRQQSLQRRSTESATLSTWDETYERVSRMWASFEHRSLPSGRGRFLDAALAMVEEAMERLYPGEAEGKKDETAERGLSRVIERIAGMTSSDPAVVAYLLLQRRKNK